MFFGQGTEHISKYGPMSRFNIPSPWLKWWEQHWTILHSSCLNSRCLQFISFLLWSAFQICSFFFSVAVILVSFLPCASCVPCYGFALAVLLPHLLLPLFVLGNTCLACSLPTSEWSSFLQRSLSWPPPIASIRLTPLCPTHPPSESWLSSPSSQHLF